VAVFGWCLNGTAERFQGGEWAYPCVLPPARPQLRPALCNNMADAPMLSRVDAPLSLGSVPLSSPVIRATTTPASTCIGAQGATSYGASVAANPPGHKSNAGARGTSALLVAPGRLARADSLYRHRPRLIRIQVHSTAPGRDDPNSKLQCDDRLATDGIRASGRQHSVQDRHANRSLTLLGSEAAGAQPRPDQRLVAAHCRFYKGSLAVTGRDLTVMMRD
jgi:hypothetical protein